MSVRLNSFTGRLSLNSQSKSLCKRDLTESFVESRRDVQCCACEVAKFVVQPLELYSKVCVSVCINQFSQTVAQNSLYKCLCKRF